MLANVSFRYVTYGLQIRTGGTQSAVGTNCYLKFTYT